MAKNFNDENFQTEVIEASKTKPVLVDFFAPWCGPCQMMAPIIEELSKEVEKTAIVGKLNTEEAQATAAKYGIMSIPTLLIFKNSEIVETISGVQSKDTLIELLKKY